MDPSKQRLLGSYHDSDEEDELPSLQDSVATVIQPHATSATGIMASSDTSHSRSMYYSTGDGHTQAYTHVTSPISTRPRVPPPPAIVTLATSAYANATSTNNIMTQNNPIRQSSTASMEQSGVYGDTTPIDTSYITPHMAVSYDAITADTYDHVHPSNDTKSSSQSGNQKPPQYNAHGYGYAPDQSVYDDHNSEASQYMHRSLPPPLTMNDSWAHVQETIAAVFDHQTDKYIDAFYQYYHRRGYNPLLARAIVHCLSQLLFVVAFLFVVGCINYKQLHHHFANPTCVDGSANTGNLYDTDCYGNTPISMHHLSSDSAYMWLVALILLGIALFDAAVMMQSRKIWREIRNLYNNKLHIQDSQLHFIEWDEVLSKFITIMREYQLGVQFPKSMDHADVHGMICQRSNFSIGLFLQPFIKSSITIAKIPFLYGTLQWSLDYCIKMCVFDAHGYVSDLVKSGSAQERRDVAKALKNWFLIIGLGNLLLTPIILLAQVTRFCFSDFEFLQNPWQFTKRQFSPYAQWLIREYNELPHDFNARIKSAQQPANDYLNARPYTVAAVIARAVMVAAGGIVVVTIVFSFTYDVNFLFSPFWMGRTVAWWCIALAIVFIVSSFYLPSLISTDPVTSMNNLRSTCVYFDAFAGKETDEATFNRIEMMFPYRLDVLLNEMLSVLTTPCILLLRLPAVADNIVVFYAEGTVTHDCIGDIYSRADYRASSHRGDVVKSMQRESEISSSMPTIINVTDDANDHKTVTSLRHFTEKVGSWSIPSVLRQQLHQSAPSKSSNGSAHW